MPVLVLPASLSEPCALPRELEVPGTTVGEVLLAAARAHPELGTRLLDGAGDVRRYYSVFLNDEDVRGKGGLDAAVGAGDVVFVAPPISGGSPDRPRVDGRPPSRPARGGWLADAAAHAESAYPEEACGLVLRTPGGGLEAVGSPNVAEDPLRHFEVEPAALVAALRAGSLHGVYHSHPDGPAEPSPEDVEKATLWGAELEWTVIPVARGRAGQARSFGAGGGALS